MIVVAQDQVGDVGNRGGPYSSSIKYYVSGILIPMTHS